MPQVLSSTPPATTAHAVDSFDHFASGEPLAPELADLVSRIQSWRDHKTFKAQAMPDELKFSIVKLLTSGLHSRAALAKQLGISYNQVANIEANFVNHSDLNTNQSVDLNFLPFKIIPHNQTINSVPDSNGNDQVSANLDSTISPNSQPITIPVSVNQVKDIIIHKADGANLTLPTNLPSEFLYNITQLFLCSK